MHNLLIFAPMPLRPSLQAIRTQLLSGGYAIACPDLEGPQDAALEELQQAFSGRPPDLVIADLSANRDGLPLRRVERLMRLMWGDSSPVPPCLALLCPRDLARPDWLAAADDFLLPPYAPEEAMARVRLLLFRRRHVTPVDTLKFAGLTLILVGGQAQDSAGSVLPLRPREYDLLRFLVTHRGKFFSRGQLLDMVWGIDFEGTERTVDIHIRRLRAKLPPQATALLETRRGVGYGFRVPE